MHILQNFYGAFTYAFLSLFSIVNPIGMAPIFLNMTKDYPARERYKIALRVALYGSILLIMALFFGLSILRFFGISLPFIQVSGGLLVFFTAWEMLNAKPKIKPDEELEALHSHDITFFPLTMPITAGAGSLAITIAIASSLGRDPTWDMGSQYLGVIAAMILVFIFVWICYRFSDSIFTKLGTTGTSVVTRLTAFILLAIGLQMVWSGFQQLILTTMQLAVSMKPLPF
jgi:multiple antibiotic resistance protein